MASCLSGPIAIPIQKLNISGRKSSSLGHDLSFFPLRMVRVALAVESPATLGGLEEHPGTARIRRAIGHAVLNDVNVDPRAQRLMQSLLSRAVHNFFNRKILQSRMLAVKQGGR